MAEEKNNKIFYFKYFRNDEHYAELCLHSYDYTTKNKICINSYGRSYSVINTPSISLNTYDKEFIKKFDLYMCDNMIFDPLKKRKKEDVIKAFPD
jgi:hypothetical protein